MGRVDRCLMRDVVTRMVVRTVTHLTYPGSPSKSLESKV